jgi:hypothetical protein
VKTGHVLIVGQTESGKSICGKKIAAAYRAQGIKVAVLDPMRDPGWQADYLSTDPVEFLSTVKDPNKCQQCAIFVDESGSMLDKYAEECNWLTTMSRHHGHVTHIIAQRAQQVSVTIRSNCSTLYAFQIDPDDAKKYSKDFNNPLILKCPALPQGHCYRVQRFKGASLLRMW